MLVVVAVLVNYPWERLQSPLYVHPGRAGIPWWLCLAASLADGLFVVAIFGVGWIALGRRRWFEQPGIEGYIVMLILGGRDQRRSRVDHRSCAALVDVW